MARTVRIGDVSNLLATAKSLIEAGEYGDALRLVDRAWRIGQQSLLICKLYMTLLVGQGFPEQALFARAQFSTEPAPPDIAAIEVQALRLLDRLDQACKVLEETVANFAIVPGGSFADAGRALIGALPDDYAGWIGISPDLSLTGDIRVSPTGSELAIEQMPAAILHNLAIVDGWASPAQIAAQSYAPGASMRLVDGRKLIGSKLQMPADYGLDVTIASLSDGIAGELGYRWHPFVPQLRHIAGHTSHAIDVAANPEMPGRYAFQISRKFWQRITPARAELVADLPDGRTVPLPGSPFPLTQAASPENSVAVGGCSVNI